MYGQFEGTDYTQRILIAHEWGELANGPPPRTLWDQLREGLNEEWPTARSTDDDVGSLLHPESFKVDPDLPPGTVEFRDHEGKVLGRMVNADTRCHDPSDTDRDLDELRAKHRAVVLFRPRIDGHLRGGWFATKHGETVLVYQAGRTSRTLYRASEADLVAFDPHDTEHVANITMARRAKARGH